MGRRILGPAHGAAAEHGAVLVAEATTLKDLGTPPDAARTEEGLALRRVRGRPFQKGNTAASGRGPSLTRVSPEPEAPVDLTDPEERRRARRKATSLAAKRTRELEVQTGGQVSSAVRVEVVAWASATAWAEMFERAGDPLKAAALREKASGHGLKALGLAERESAARDAADPVAEKRLAFQRRLREDA